MATRDSTETAPAQAEPYDAFCLRISSELFDASAMVDGALRLCQDAVEDWETNLTHCSTQRLLVLARDALQRISEEVSGTEFSYSGSPSAQLSKGDCHAN